LSPVTGLQIIRENLRTYLVANAAVYGLFVAGFGAGLLFPQLSEAQYARLEDDGTAGTVAALVASPWLFALAILGVNTVKMALLTIVVPSMIVPFAGIALFAYWVLQTGATLVPASDIGWVALIPHSLTLVIELQAYVLLLLGVYLLGTRWLWPPAAGTRRQGYVAGLRQLGWLSLPAAALLIVGAVYEAFSLRYFIHPLVEWLV
jgi:hypothetical protein